MPITDPNGEYFNISVKYYGYFHYSRVFILIFHNQKLDIDV